MADVTAPPLSVDEAVEINVPLRAEHAATLRVVVAALGSDHGLTVDEIDDLKLAVSEVFTVLIDDAEQAGARRSSVRFWSEPGVVSVHLRRDIADEVIELDALATTILTSVVDDHAVGTDGVTLVKRNSER